MATLVIEYIGTPCLAYTSNRASPEWPPSPDRIYQALVATACELDMEVQPLLELEKIRPSIKYPDAALIDSAKVFVRSNQTVKQTPAGVSRPYIRAPQGERLYYRYPGLSSEVEDWFRVVARNVTHIGRSQSQVIADVVDDDHAPTPEWEPHDRGDLMFNTPYSGRLWDLDHAFNAGQRSQAASMVPYRQVKNKYPSSYWRDLIVLKPDRKLHLVRAVQVAEALRQAILSVCGDDAPNWIHGHAQDNHHIAITPLPNVGHRYGDGMMTGIGIWLPKMLNRKERAEIAFRVADISKIQCNGLEFSVAVQYIEQVATRADTWSRMSRKWTSVTPVVLDRYPKRGKLTSEQIVADSCIHSGLPKPVSVQLLTLPELKGVPMSREFKTRTNSRLYQHVTLNFKTPVWGPVLVGRERFFGMGMFRPL